MKKTNTLFILCVILLMTSCSRNKDIVDKVNDQNVMDRDDELIDLFGLMQGSFNSAEQAKLDTSYYNISLHMYPIWEDRGLYLYVEQALSTMQDKPYRQRVYKVSRLDDKTIKSEIFKLEADSIWIGKWKNPKLFERLTEEDLILRNGCEVLLQKVGNQNYRGTTGEKTCESTMRGASYATSEVEILSGKIISWDRGFDAYGNHKWGAEKGGYIFKKLERVYRAK